MESIKVLTDVNEAKRSQSEFTILDSEKIKAYEEENKKSENILNMLERIRQKRIDDLNNKLSQKEDKFIEV
jgi:hypothetical protein